MPSIRQTGQQDGRMARDAMREISPAIEEQLQVLQWVSQSGGNPQHGVANTDVYNTINTRGNVSDLTAQELFYPGSIYVAGDLHVELRIQVFGAISVAGEDGQAAGRKSDLVLYRGRKYGFVGHINRIQAMGRVYWAGVMRPLGT